MYLYLSKKDYEDTWINGGKIPIKLASAYRQDEHHGIYTPDENAMKTASSNITNTLAASVLSVEPTVNNLDVTNLKISGQARIAYPPLFSVVGDDVKIDNVLVMRGDHTDELLYSGDFRQNYADALILCGAKIYHPILMSRLKKEVCIKIKDLLPLQEVIDKQLGIKSIFGNCKYTDLVDRNHFLKSSESRYQNEWRLVWELPYEEVSKYPNGVEVVIPPGIAESFNNW